MFSSLNTGALKIELPLADALTLARDTGFEGLDLSIDQVLQRAAQTSVKDVCDLFANAGVRAGAWGLPVNFRSDQAVFERDLERLPRYAELADRLGSPWCSTWILPFSDTLTYEENMELHASRLRPVCSILAQHGCQCGLEFVGPATMRAGKAHQFIFTISGALDLARRIGTGNVGLLLDCYHWYTSHGTIDDIRQLTAHDVVYVHINDAVAGRAVDEQLDQGRRLPGASGLIDIAGFLSAVHGLGYQGPVAVEPFDATVNALPVPERAQAAAASLRTVFSLAVLPRN